jgi:anti-sigma B factor antagonist
MPDETDSNDLPFRFTSEPPVLVVHLHGEIDLDNAPTISKAVMGHVAGLGSGDLTQVVVDMGEVVFMDSSGLNALLTCQARLAERDTGFVVRNATGPIRRLFEITGLDGLFED